MAARGATVGALGGVGGVPAGTAASRGTHSRRSAGDTWADAVPWRRRLQVTMEADVSQDLQDFWAEYKILQDTQKSPCHDEDDYGNGSDGEYRWHGVVHKLWGLSETETKHFSSMHQAVVLERPTVTYLRSYRTSPKTATTTPNGVSCFPLQQGRCVLIVVARVRAKSV